MADPCRAPLLFAGAASDKDTALLPFRPPPGLENQLWSSPFLTESQSQSACAVSKLSPRKVALPSWFPPPPGLSLPWERQNQLEDEDTATPGGDHGWISECSTVAASDWSGSSTPRAADVTGFRRHAARAVDYQLSEVLFLEVPPPPCPVLELSPFVPPCPSVGSAYHHLGQCRPCDFLTRGAGCRAGTACKFCHICGRRENRMKKKMRKQMGIAHKQVVASLSGLSR